jgi:hypothetical protein
MRHRGKLAPLNVAAAAAVRRRPRLAFLALALSAASLATLFVIARSPTGRQPRAPDLPSAGPDRREHVTAGPVVIGPPKSRDNPAQHPNADATSDDNSARVVGSVGVGDARPAASAAKSSSSSLSSAFAGKDAAGRSSKEVDEDSGKEVDVSANGGVEPGGNAGLGAELVTRVAAAGAASGVRVAVVVPFRASEAPALLALWRAWATKSGIPCGQDTRDMAELVLYIDGSWDDHPQLRSTLIAAWSHAVPEDVQRCFGTAADDSLGLMPTFISAGLGPEVGYPAGPCEMHYRMFALLEDLPGRLTHAFVNELDVLPVRARWLDRLRAEAAGDAVSGVWVRGSAPRCAFAYLAERSDRHINGNALFRLKDPEYQAFRSELRTTFVQPSTGTTIIANPDAPRASSVALSAAGTDRASIGLESPQTTSGPAPVAGVKPTAAGQEPSQTGVSAGLDAGPSIQPTVAGQATILRSSMQLAVAGQATIFRSAPESEPGRQQWAVRPGQGREREPGPQPQTEPRPASHSLLAESGPREASVALSASGSGVGAGCVAGVAYEAGHDHAMWQYLCRNYDFAVAAAHRFAYTDVIQNLCHLEYEPGSLSPSTHLVHSKWGSICEFDRSLLRLWRLRFAQDSAPPEIRAAVLSRVALGESTVSEALCALLPAHPDCAKQKPIEWGSKLPGVVYLWSADFDAGPAMCAGSVLRSLGSTIHIESDDPSCSHHGVCRDRLRVLHENQGLGLALEPCPYRLRRRFYESYRDDPEFRRVDAFFCASPAANCELFLPFARPFIVYIADIAHLALHRWPLRLTALATKLPSHQSAPPPADPVSSGSLRQNNITARTERAGMPQPALRLRERQAETAGGRIMTAAQEWPIVGLRSPQSMDDDRPSGSGDAANGDGDPSVQDVEAGDDRAGGRAARRWSEWAHWLGVVSRVEGSSVLAGSELVARYVRHHTGVTPEVLPPWCGFVPGVAAVLQEPTCTHQRETYLPSHHSFLIDRALMLSLGSHVMQTLHRLGAVPMRPDMGSTEIVSYRFAVVSPLTSNIRLAELQRLELPLLAPEPALALQILRPFPLAPPTPTSSPPGTESWARWAARRLGTSANQEGKWAEWLPLGEVYRLPQVRRFASALQLQALVVTLSDDDLWRMSVSARDHASRTKPTHLRQWSAVIDRVTTAKRAGFPALLDNEPLQMRLSRLFGPDANVWPTNDSQPDQCL